MKLLTLLICSLFIPLLTLTVSSSAQAETRVYVSATTGSDITGNGSQGNPWATIGKALVSGYGTSGNRYNILVAQGVYNENGLQLGRYDTILGGYHPSTWQRNIAAYQSIVDGGGPSSYIFRGEDYSTIDGLYLRNSEKGLYCYSSSPTISRCHISNCEIGISTAEGAIIDSVIFENNGRGIFGGTNVDTGHTTTIINNLILSSNGTIASGIASVSNNMICINNTIDCNAYGIRVQKSSRAGPPTVLIQNNNITRNSPSDGIYLSDSATYGVDLALITIKYNNVWGNATNYDGCSPGVGDISQNPLYVQQLPTAPISKICRNTAEAIEAEDALLNELDKAEREAYPKDSDKEGELPHPLTVRTVQTASNYRLAAGSPSIDAGTNQDAPTEDILDFARPNPDTGIADIGCYEFHFPTPEPGPTPAGEPVPFVEDFEGVWSGGAPSLWIKQYYSGTTDWIKASGGFNGHPAAAHGGTSNALLFKPDYTGPATRLISPALDFNSRTGNARLTFWHAMGDFSGDQDELEVYYRTSVSAPWTLLAAYNGSVPNWTQRTISLPNPGNGYYICFQGTANFGYGVCLDDVLVTGDSTESSSPILDSGDYNGDGTSDIAVFRPSSGLWSVRGVTRVYFGSSSDIVAPGDYNGDGTTDIGVFRPASGLWGVRGVTRVYYGSSTDIPVPGDYNGDGRCDIGIFRPGSGLWSIRGVTRVYYGGSSDIPVPGDYNGDGRKEIALFRGSSGMWAIRGLPRVYYGSSSDSIVPGDYNGDGTWEVGIFRPSTGMWGVAGVTRAYFGSNSDRPVPADYNGDNSDDIAVFRDSSGLWGVKGVTRVYFGTSGDVSVTR